MSHGLDADGPPCAFGGLCHFCIRCDTGYCVEKSYYRACLLKGSTYCFFKTILMELNSTTVEPPQIHANAPKITMVFGLLQYLQYYHQTAASESWQTAVSMTNHDELFFIQ